jgi:hypothetical protein
VRSDTSAALPPGCFAWADPPIWDSSGWIRGIGGWYGCPYNSWGKVVLRQDRAWLPDVTLDEWSGTGGSFTAQLSERCYTSGTSIKVFVETRFGNGDKVQSQHENLPCHR